MKKRLQGLIAGVLIGAMLTSGVVFAKNIHETINAVYMNVKLVIDGEEITPKDANGNIVEPFIYNGTTYLPVRGTANLAGANRPLASLPCTAPLHVSSISAQLV